MATHGRGLICLALSPDYVDNKLKLPMMAQKNESGFGTNFRITSYNVCYTKLLRKFACDQCNAQYMIADEKIGARGVKVKCKKCSHIIVVKLQPAAETEIPAPLLAGADTAGAMLGGGASAAPAVSDSGGGVWPPPDAAPAAASVV